MGLYPVVRLARRRGIEVDNRVAKPLLCDTAVAAVQLLYGATGVLQAGQLIRKTGMLHNAKVSVATDRPPYTSSGVA